jgi:hypothetical protein
MDAPRERPSIHFPRPNGTALLHVALELIEVLWKSLGGTVISVDLTDAAHGEFVIRILIEQLSQERFAVDWAS